MEKHDPNDSDPAIPPIEPREEVPSLMAMYAGVCNQPEWAHDEGSGYYESDRDYVEKNMEAAIMLLEREAKQQGRPTHVALEGEK